MNKQIARVKDITKIVAEFHTGHLAICPLCPRSPRLASVEALAAYIADKKQGIDYQAGEDEVIAPGFTVSQLRAQIQQTIKEQIKAWHDHELWRLDMLDRLEAGPIEEIALNPSRLIEAEEKQYRSWAGADEIETGKYADEKFACATCDELLPDTEISFWYEATLYFFCSDEHKETFIATLPHEPELRLCSNCEDMFVLSPSTLCSKCST